MLWRVIIYEIYLSKDAEDIDGIAGDYTILPFTISPAPFF
jgi:hypothetical protein